jgi:DNA-binding NtrC family response regulator
MASYNVLVVDDNDAHRKLYASVVERLSLNCYKADCPKAAFEVLKEVEVNLVISDMRMPGMSGIEFLKNAREKKYDMPFLLVTAYPAIKDAVVALKLGAVDYLEKPVDLMELETVIKETLKLNTETVAEGLLNSDLSQQYGIVTENQYMKQIINDCLPVAKSDITTLLIGESGTGKEVFASFIHKMSLREGKAFVAVNCASIPAELLGSELFGHV